ncbi:hypothetical protein ACXDF8_05735 [Mycolicibacterium sp. CBM1]
MATRGVRLWHVVALTALFFGVVLLAGLAISATASGAPSCTNVSPTTTICQSPGNAQITTTPGTIATPNWGWPFWGGGLILSIG